MHEVGRANDNGQAVVWALGGLLQMQHAPHKHSLSSHVDELGMASQREAHRHHLSRVDRALTRARLALALWRLGRRAEAYVEAASNVSEKQFLALQSCWPKSCCP